MERVGVEIHGPFSIRDIGNHDVLVVMDYFSEWQQVHVVPDQLLPQPSDWCANSPFGAPVELHNSCAREWASENQDNSLLLPEWRQSTGCTTAADPPDFAKGAPQHLASRDTWLSICRIFNSVWLRPTTSLQLLLGSRLYLSNYIILYKPLLWCIYETKHNFARKLWARWWKVFNALKLDIITSHATHPQVWLGAKFTHFIE